MRPGDLQRTIDLGVVASMQPTHATSDMWMAEKRLGPARLAGVTPGQRCSRTALYSP